jgi:hypothetical protein
VIYFSETSVDFPRIIRPYIPTDRIVQCVLIFLPSAFFNEIIRYYFNLSHNIFMIQIKKISYSIHKTLFSDQRYYLNVLFSILISYLLELQPYAGFGIFHGSIKVNFWGVRLLTSLSSPNMENQGLHFVWPRTFDLSGMGDPTRSFRSRWHSSPRLWGAQTSSPR